ncbi:MULTISPECIES: alpha/beta fold hydrolase [Oceanobacillus]|uniref:Alpha/beta fold hydrolase n=2 Tax=Oceanobacillus TaxID=182709 RepID=A0ABV9K2T3_9BACI|nr:alpha/beta fold hydrolase [Oceanobacillus oncorhynchi]MDM8099755.1 alpha/beta fold hydrolase [Oceanobacillus oncorhynchi]
MKFIDMNGKKIEILSKRNGKPAILILTGMGSPFYEWEEIISALEENSQIIMFHRPGLGESEFTNTKKSTENVTKEIIQILEKLNITEPVVLIGHSYGGLCAQHLSKIYPNKIRGLLLLDSTSVDLYKLDQLDLPYLNENDSDAAWIEKCIEYASLSPLELSKQLAPILTENQKKLPQNIQEKLIAFYINPLLYKTMVQEITSWEKDAETIKSLPFTGSFPVTIIGRDKKKCISNHVKSGIPKDEAELLEETWHQLIIEQQAIYKNAKLLFALDAGHDIYFDQPQLVIKEIKELIHKRLS